MFKLVDKITYLKLSLYILPGLLIWVLSTNFLGIAYFIGFIIYVLLVIYSESKAMNPSILFPIGGLLFVAYFGYVMAVYDIRSSSGMSWTGDSFELLHLVSYICMVTITLLNIGKIATSFGSNRNQAFMNENQIDNTTFINTIQSRGRETNWAERTYYVEEGRTTNEKVK